MPKSAITTPLHIPDPIMFISERLFVNSAMQEVISDK